MLSGHDHIQILSKSLHHPAYILNASLNCPQKRRRIINGYVSMLCRSYAVVVAALFETVSSEWWRYNVIRFLTEKNGNEIEVWNEGIIKNPVSLTSTVILSTNLSLGLPSGLFPFGFPTNILYVLPSPLSCYMPCSSLYGIIFTSQEHA
jgi:hypothetical protein